eukprot:55184-Amorphochlora_amoeboformis.AAC.1
MRDKRARNERIRNKMLGSESQDMQEQETRDVREGNRKCIEGENGRKVYRLDVFFYPVVSRPITQSCVCVYVYVYMYKASV